MEDTKIRILDPTLQAIPDSTFLARRPETLNGAVLGLLSNGKRNSKELLDSIYSLLQGHYELKGTIYINKGDSSRPAPQHVIDQLLEKCDLVITATGD